MKSQPRFILFAATLLIAQEAVSTSHAADDPAATFAARVRPILQTHCGDCHGGDKPEAKLDLTAAPSLADLQSQRDAWFKVLTQIEAGSMPPAGEKPLSPEQTAAISNWIRGDFTALHVAKQLAEGRSSFRRLSRNEYANTVQDLFGMRPLVATHLPEDGRVDGYDKVAAALPLSSDAALGYTTMANDLLGKWVLKQPYKGYDGSVAGRTVRAAAMESGQSPGHSLVLPDGVIVSFNSDTTSGRLKYGGARVPGMHTVRAAVFGYQTEKPLPFGVYVGNTGAYPQVLELAAVLEAPPGKLAVVETEIYLRQGSGIRLIPFGIGEQVPKNTQASKCKGPGLAVQYVETVEPELPLIGDRWLTADFPPELIAELRGPYKRFLNPGVREALKPKSVTRESYLALVNKTLVRVSPRLLRREVAPAEIERMTAAVGKRIDAGTSLDGAFLEAIGELLTDPEFFCIVEKPGKLDDYALASRLAYFLWNSTPDDELFSLAQRGQLRQPGVLKAQTERLLNDPKAERFVRDFCDQWLGLRAIDDTSPDRMLYPEYYRNELLKFSSVDETRAFFRKLLAENLGVRHLVDSPWAMVNEPLAKLYGLPGVEGAALREVKLPAGSPRGGLWTHSAILKVTANGTNTSPVKRGVWVAERLLGTPIPPPPPSVEPVNPDTRGAKTLREQLALHREAAACAGCHAKFDPFGFALESFDVTGAYRQNYRIADAETLALPVNQRKGRALWRDGLPVDASGELPDGRKFAGVSELRQLLAADAKPLARGVAKHLLTYATGAPTTGVDRAAVDAMVEQAAADNFGLRSLIHAVVQSGVFQMK